MRHGEHLHMNRRQALLVAPYTALLLTKPHLAWGATIVAVRVWPAADYTSFYH